MVFAVFSVFSLGRRIVRHGLSPSRAVSRTLSLSVRVRVCEIFCALGRMAIACCLSRVPTLTPHLLNKNMNRGNTTRSTVECTTRPMHTTLNTVRTARSPGSTPYRHSPVEQSRTKEQPTSFEDPDGHEKAAGSAFSCAFFMRCLMRCISASTSSHLKPIAPIAPSLCERLE